MKTEYLPRRIFAGFTGLVFIWFAILQINDPDPARWITVYSLTSLAGLYSVISPVHAKAVSLFVILLSISEILWAVLIWPGGGELYWPDAMHNERDELVRESAGLAISAVFLLIHGVWFRRKK